MHDENQASIVPGKPDETCHGIRHQAAPLIWQDGFPVGNGFLGAMIWGDGAPLCFTLDCADLWDSRTDDSFWRNPEYTYANLRRLFVRAAGFVRLGAVVCRTKIRYIVNHYVTHCRNIRFAFFRHSPCGRAGKGRLGRCFSAARHSSAQSASPPPVFMEGAGHRITPLTKGRYPLKN